MFSGEWREIELNQEFPIFDPAFTQKERGFLDKPTLRTGIILSEERVRLPIEILAVPGNSDTGVELFANDSTRGYQFNDDDLDPDLRAAKLAEAWRLAGERRGLVDKGIRKEELLPLLTASTVLTSRSLPFKILNHEASLTLAQRLQMQILDSTGQKRLGYGYKQVNEVLFDNFFPDRGDGKTPAIPEEPVYGQGFRWNGLVLKEGNPLVLPASISKIRGIQATFGFGTKGIPEWFIKAFQ